MYLCSTGRKRKERRVKISSNQQVHVELTSPEYWDSWWNGFNITEPPIPANEPQFGQEGFFLRAVERHTGSLIGKSVVELGGCMSYRLLAMAKWRGARVTAVDYSRAGIEATRRFFDHNGCSAALICADFFSPELDGLEFDLVTHWGVVEHQADPLPVIRRSLELTKSGGYIMFSMPQMRGPGAWLWRRWSPVNWARHIYHSDTAIIEAFGQCGVQCKRLDFGPPFIIWIDYCETDNVFTRIARTAQRWINRAARLGLPYHLGVQHLSESRAFVAHKTIQPVMSVPQGGDGTG